MFELCVRWLAWGLDTSLKAALVALVAAAFLRLLRLRDSNIRHRIWTAVLAGMLALPVLTPLMPALRLPLLPSPEWLVAWTSEPAAPEALPQPRPPNRSSWILRTHRSPSYVINRLQPRRWNQIAILAGQRLLGHFRHEALPQRPKLPPTIVHCPPNPSRNRHHPCHSLRQPALDPARHSEPLWRPSCSSPAVSGFLSAHCFAFA